MQGVILAAGKGSRLHPLTLKRSKAMLPILGKPIVERVMEDLAVHGIGEFILVASPDDDQIRRYFEQESGLAATVRFVNQPERRGMADALDYAAPLIEGDFILSACDNLVPADHIGQMVERFRTAPHPDGVLSLMRVERERQGDMGMVEMEGEWIRRIVEKPSPGQVPSDMASLPLYLFSAKILEYLPQVPLSGRGEYELQDAIQMLIEHGGMVCGVTAPGRLTLTSPADLLRINRHFLVEGGGEVRVPAHAIGEGTRLVPPLYIESGSQIGAGCTIGPQVVIERDCRIGDEVSLQKAVLLRGVSIPAGSKILNQVVS